MVDVPLKTISDSVQMYLVKLKRLEDKMKPVPLSFLADSLSISPVSVNEMCRKMQEQNLIDYQPYKGASLTEEGERAALQILRRHRLWEVFLVEKLNFSYTEAHEMADALEHATSKDLADHLSIFLGNPTVNPEGKEIPSGDGKLAKITKIPLADLAIGDVGICILDDQEGSIRDYLSQSGCVNGTNIQILGKTDQLVLVQVNQKYVNISSQLSEKIKVIKGNKDREQVEEVDNTEEIATMSVKEKLDISQLTLDKVKIGEKGTIVGVTGKGAVKQRMMDMGLVPGSDVEVVRVAPLGDPIEILLKGYNLSLRRNEAKLVLVELNKEA